MRFAARLLAALSLTATACTSVDDPEVVTEIVEIPVNHEIVNTVVETVTVEVPVEETEGVYYVPDVSGQVHETNTQLEFVDGYRTTLTSVAPDVSSDLDCMVANFRTPEDAGQGVILERVEWGALANGWESNGWENHIVTVGYGSHEMVLGQLQMFWDPDDLVGAELVYDGYDFDPWWSGLSYYDRSIGWSVENEFYVPAGGTASLGFCAAWEKDWQNPEEAPTESWMWFYAMLGRIQWVPADTQDVTSQAIVGLTLPVTSTVFPEL